MLQAYCVILQFTYGVVKIHTRTGIYYAGGKMKTLCIVKMSFVNKKNFKIDRHKKPKSV